MPPYTTLLEEALESWQDVRNGVIEELEVLRPDEMGFRPGPQSRSVAELVQHIIEQGLMMSGELTRPDGDFRRQGGAEFVAEYAGHVGRTSEQAGLLELLRQSHADGERHFREAGELFLLQYIHRFDGLPGTRFAWMQHGIAHEMYHRGQLALYVRLAGHVPALTQKIG